MSTSEIVTAALTLKPVEAEHFDEAYVGTTQPCPWPKAYGGDLVGPATAALARSVGGDRSLHSMHSYFLRPADIGAEVRYEVEHLRDGRGYSTRHLRAYQSGKVVYAAMASFHVTEAGDTFESAFPDGVPDPSSLPSAAEYLRDEPVDAASKVYWSGGRGFDMRHVPGPVYLRVEGSREPHQAVWVKPFDPLRPVDGLTRDQLHTAALAYVCDYTILEPVLRVLDRPWDQAGLVTASLDHAMWFHRRGSVDDWLLYAQDAIAADGGRGLGTGRFFTRDGRHLATVAQEGMIRAASGKDKSLWPRHPPT
ncbi:acyl-CoA thioesterase [Actinoplanes subtropicus]|uniref:acyl-CoA thioesterase n=1 Tax=Actinoplanes subtropicus TaxID=543632 RepID=UPI000690D6CA|nr:acyl-CoA thioesterase domain-containing protein [Actinoplanes subtropicus]